VLHKANSILSITTWEERECWANLAAQVPEGGRIVEIGALYGGVTAVLALAAPAASVFTIDNFSWHPEGHPPTSAELLREHMDSVGARNVYIIQGDSREIGMDQAFGHIDMLCIDGGHSYEFVFVDLMLFGTRSDVIALHDYDNPSWPTVKDAVNDFLKLMDGKFELTNVVGQVATLRRK
jgi:predicted O-methyltransferase YrrM